MNHPENGSDSHRLPDPERSLYRLTPAGRALYEQAMQALSQEIGRPLTREEVLVALRRLREETGLDDPPLAESAIFDHLMQLLRRPPNA